MAVVTYNRRVLAYIGVFIAIVFEAGASAQPAKRFRLGYFEGGAYPVNSILREEFIRQLKLVLPEGYEFVFVPEGYRSAGWKRDSCRDMARQLVKVASIDIVIAVGPWVVEDLLEAGFTKPILAMHQFAPVAQGLVGDDNRPVAPNLTVHVRPGKVGDDLRVLTKILEVKRLGVLYFPSGDEAEKVISAIASLGEKLGFEVVTAEGFDNYGTYAFFKAYYQLDKKIDALYLPPLWGIDAIRVQAFFQMLARDRIPAFTYEAKDLVESGAFASGAAYSIVSEARYNALKAARIMQGELPANLPLEFRSGTALALNEQTAQQCQIALLTEIVNDAYLVAAPVPETVSHYTLPEAVERALSYNPGYLSRYDALEATAQAAKQAFSAYLPQVVAGMSATHLDDNTVANSGGRFESDRYRSTLLLHQTIFSVEAIKTIQVAAKRRNLEKINLRQARLDLELAVTAAYLNYLGARELLKTQLHYRTLVDRNLEIAGTRLLLERGDQIDLLRWKDERHQATSRVINARKNLQVATVLLNVLFNLPGNSPFVLDRNLFSKRRFVSDYNMLRSQASTADDQVRLQDFAVDKALDQNPFLRSYDVDIAIQRDLLSKSTARYYPTLDFRASLNYSDELVDNPPVFTEENTTWSLWGGLTLPIFLGTDRIRERAKLKARLNQVEFEKDAASLKVMGKVRSGMYDLVAQGSNGLRAERSAELAGENLKLVSKKYEAGKKGLIDLLDALDNAHDAEESSIVARYNFYLSMACLVHDIGWSPSEGNETFREVFNRQLDKNFNQ